MLDNNKYKIEETQDYDALVQFFVINELEFDGDEEVDTDIIKCYRLIDENEKLLGGAVLAKREGEFIIDGIAVDASLRGAGLGNRLLEIVLDEARKRGGKTLALVARAPDFFKKAGFYPISTENSPNFFECKTCPQYMKTCFPELLRINL